MRVLIADDDPVTRQVLASALPAWGYEVVEAADGEAARAALEGEDPPRLAVLDWMMEPLSGVEICRRVREANREPYIYILVLTVRGEQEDVIEGLDAGADDYLVKPFDLQELEVRLRAGRRVVSLQEELRVQARHDPLTGGLNRRAIAAVLEEEYARAERNGTSLGVVLCDLDEFKRINDAHGHASGDLVLRAAHARMAHLLRPYDHVGRFGGEEFLLVLPDCDLSEAERIAERIRAEVAAHAVETPAGPLSVTVSAGVYASPWQSSVPATDLVAAADAALYRAKTAGRNRVAVALGTALRPEARPSDEAEPTA